MEYKEKYEQALMIAQETYNTQPMYKEWLEKMFPELAESEDEKVRKEIISYLKTRKGYTEAIKDHWIAWLENIPYTIDHEKREGFYLGYKACHEKQGEQKPTDEEMKTLLRTEYEKGRADAIAGMQMEWSEEDEKNFCSVYLDVKSARQNTVNSLSGELKEQEQKRMDEVISWFKSLRPQNRWKPSDEQIDALTETVHNLWGSPETTLSGLLADLKKLKEE